MYGNVAGGAAAAGSGVALAATGTNYTIGLALTAVVMFAAGWAICNLVPRFHRNR